MKRICERPGRSDSSPGANIFSQPDYKSNQNKSKIDARQSGFNFEKEGQQNGHGLTFSE